MVAIGTNKFLTPSIKVHAMLTAPARCCDGQGLWVKREVSTPEHKGFASV